MNSWHDSSVGLSVWTELCGRGFKSHSCRLSVVASKNTSVVNYWLTAIFSIFSKLAKATSNFVSKFYKGRFAPEFSVSMLKEFLTLVRDYVYDTRKYEAKLAEKYIWNRNMKSFSNETQNFFFRKFCFSYIWDLAKTVSALRILSHKFTSNSFKMAVLNKRLNKTDMEKVG